MLEQDRLLSFENLKTKFGLGDHDQYQYRYLQIRDCYEKEVRTEIGTIIGIFQKAYEGKKCRAISVLYLGLMGGRETSTVYIKEKWEKELQEHIREVEWFKICKTQCKPLAPKFGENSIGKI
ncbi:hypothetical protein AMECASPLE_024793 [Ameca splendens]|uniref:Uncharacterized protein n=1 Tax=Ameca splendens TaxID=208324 RepID=A0ABV1A268_9TELE